MIQENQDLKNRLLDLNEQIYLQDLSDNMESCILDKSVSILKSTSNYMGGRMRNTYSPNPAENRKGRNTQFERMPSDNELPDFDRKATDFTQNIKNHRSQFRDMRYSQRNYGYNQGQRGNVDFVQRMGKDPNENAFSSSNSNLMENLKFIQKRGGDPKPKRMNDMGLPVKRKGTRGRSRTPTKLNKINKESKPNSNKYIMKKTEEEEGFTKNKFNLKIKIL